MKLVKTIALFTLFYLVSNIDLFAQTDRQAKLLEQAYQTRSVSKLKKFFKNWEKEMPTISDSELNTLNKYDREAYAVFKAVYHPEQQYPKWPLSKEDSPEFSNQYKKVQFMVLPFTLKILLNNNIYFNHEERDSALKKLHPNDYQMIISNHEKYKGSILDEYDLAFPDGYFDGKFLDSIHNFRPGIDYGNKKPVYLNDQYYLMLVEFTGATNLKKGDSVAVFSKKAIRSLIRKQNFLNKLIHINYKWSSNDYFVIFFSYPVVESITLNEDLNRARISISWDMCTSESLMKKENGVWKLVSTTVTAIE